MKSKERGGGRCYFGLRGHIYSKQDVLCALAAVEAGTSPPSPRPPAEWYLRALACATSAILCAQCLPVPTANFSQISPSYLCFNMLVSQLY